MEKTIERMDIGNIGRIEKIGKKYVYTFNPVLYKIPLILLLLWSLAPSINSVSGALRRSGYPELVVPIDVILLYAVIFIIILVLLYKRQVIIDPLSRRATLVDAIYVYTIRQYLLSTSCFTHLVIRHRYRRRGEGSDIEKYDELCFVDLAKNYHTIISSLWNFCNFKEIAAAAKMLSKGLGVEFTEMGPETAEEKVLEEALSEPEGEYQEAGQDKKIEESESPDRQNGSDHLDGGHQG